MENHVVTDNLGLWVVTLYQTIPELLSELKIKKIIIFCSVVDPVHQ